MPACPLTSTSRGVPPATTCVECREQCSDLALASVEPFRHQQPIGAIALADWELVDDSVEFPIRSGSA